MENFGLHIYFNNVSLLNHCSTDGRGFPWRLAENKCMTRSYTKGACPHADSLFERSLLIPIPSCLTKQDEDDIIRA